MSLFVDEVVVEVKAGRGGNGKVAFRREAHVEFGGPFGGNGGNGGNIYFVGDEGKNTLIDLKYNRHIRAQHGANGEIKGMHGANAEHTYVRVPLGTIVYDEKNNLIGEVLYHGQELLVAKGGKGGRGNIAFATNKNQAPDFAEQGDPGQTFRAKVELQVLADVGLLGYPSVGKSTLISSISNAKAKIAPYPFTTLSPQLGMVRVDEDEFVVADLPGLIEYAHLGVGLGIQFLKHVERCRVLLHIVSMESEDPYKDYLTINNELVQYDEALKDRVQIVVANKMDTEDAEEKLKEFESKLNGIKVFPISALNREGLMALKYEIIRVLKTIPKFEPKQITKVYEFNENKDSDFVITKGDDGIFDITGEKVFILFNRTDFNNESAVKRFARQLRGIGIDEALREAGVQNGDIVRIFSYEFEYLE
ncbi:GTPase ObgE [Acholeplasma hippikon]|uniref:GTPase Obg n=1 Tax=Acholeplasma hippikon TaxID=264636 RepID=A0A449BJK0_9MOLU|nr:GTPase ObgE [Acholeplasma hippikon]VEU82629.1 GTPase obg [Acholeplasma hippikon]